MGRIVLSWSKKSVKDISFLTINLSFISAFIHAVGKTVIYTLSIIPVLRVSAADFLAGCWNYPQITILYIFLETLILSLIYTNLYDNANRLSHCFCASLKQTLLLDETTLTWVVPGFLLSACIWAWNKSCLIFKSQAVNDFILTSWIDLSIATIVFKP